jgi:hypothetical protein
MARDFLGDTTEAVNCCARRHEVDQENAFSIPENVRHQFFFTEMEILNFLVLGGMHMALLQ